MAFSTTGLQTHTGFPVHQQFLCLKKAIYFRLSLIVTCCKMTQASSEEGLTSHRKSQKCPPSSPQIADDILRQDWALLGSGQAPWLHQKEAIKALDCGPQRGWGTLRSTPAWTGCRVLQSRRESDSGTARCRSKLAVRSFQN